MNGYLSAFTPGIAPAAALERLLVEPQRAEIAARAVDLVRESAAGESKHHLLVVGPRGWGKTHLATTVYHRLRNDPSLRDSLLIARLAEEGETVTTFLDLLLRILTALEAEYPATDGVLPEDFAPRLRALYDMKLDEAERAAVSLLVDAVARRTLLVLVENLDAVFDGLGADGQHRLRAFVQDHPFWTIVATTPELFDAIRNQGAPFYGFFRAYHLGQFSVDDATEMLARIAELRGDDELASRVRAPGGRARVRAIDHLAKGTPRVYVLLSDFLTASSFEEFVGAFMKTLDGLTPYFQERLRGLTPQERKVVEFLCGRGGAAAVKEIARHCFLSHSTTSGHLKALRASGFVTSEPVGRETYYELREPLMRLWHEVKTNCGEPIRLLVEFLRLWYARDELERKLRDAEPQERMEVPYLARALEKAEFADDDIAVVACRRAVMKASEAGDYAGAARAAEELVALRGAARDWELWGISLSCSGSNDAALEKAERALVLEPDSKPALILKGIALFHLARHEDAIRAMDAAKRLAGPNALADHIRGTSFGALGRYEDAIQALDAAIQAFTAHEDTRELARAWKNRGIAARHLGRADLAIESYERVLELDPSAVSAVHALLHLYVQGEHWTKALNLSDKLIGLQEDAWAWLLKGAALAGLGRDDRALEAYDRALELEPRDEWRTACVFNRASTLSRLGKTDRALEGFGLALELGADRAAVELGRATAYASAARWDEMFEALGQALSAAPEQASIEPSLTQLIVWRVLARSSTSELRRKLSERLVSIFAKYHALADLGPGIVGSITLAARVDFDANAAMAWAEAWQRLAISHRELRLPSRILTAAVRYRQTEDRRALLELAAEEREIVEKILAHRDEDGVLVLWLPAD